MAARTPPVKPVECPRCGQLGNQPPGIRLEEYPNLTGVFVDNGEFDMGSVPTPQRLRCLSCDKTWPVVRGSIEVRRPR